MSVKPFERFDFTPMKEQVFKGLSCENYNGIMCLVQYITAHSNASIMEAIQLAKLMLMNRK